METCNHQISRKDSQDHQPKPGSSDEETGVQREHVPQGAPGPGLLSPQHMAQHGLVDSPQGSWSWGSGDRPRRVTSRVSHISRGWRLLRFWLRKAERKASKATNSSQVAHLRPRTMLRYLKEHKEFSPNNIKSQCPAFNQKWPGMQTSREIRPNDRGKKNN